MVTDDTDGNEPESSPTASDIPMLGLGTWQNEDPDQCAETVRTALETGYRHIDTAQIYDNEAAVGEGSNGPTSIARTSRDEDLDLESGPRGRPQDGSREPRPPRRGVRRRAVRPLARADVRSRGDAGSVHGTPRGGQIENVGVSNFLPEQVAEATAVSDVPILANQVELHPLLPQDDVREACAAHDIEVVAYSPLARGAVFDEPVLQEIAADHGVSEAR